MKIYKRPDNVIYDTEAPGKTVQLEGWLPWSSLVPLHQSINLGDWDFLSGFFPEGHPVFSNFGNAYYYTQEEEKASREISSP